MHSQIREAITGEMDEICDSYSCCIAQSKKAHNWALEHLAELFRTTAKVNKTYWVAGSLCQRCGEFELAAYLADASGPVPLIIAHYLVMPGRCWTDGESRS